MRSGFAGERAGRICRNRHYHSEQRSM